MDWTGLCVLLLIPAVMMLLGAIFLKRSPRKINDWFGYRTRRAMSSQEAWDFAHRTCGRIWLRWGAVLAVATVLVVLLLGRGEASLLSSWGGTAVLLQCGVMIVSTVPVDQALKRNFDQDGHPINKEN